MDKTKKQLLLYLYEDLNTAIAKAKSQYDSTVKPEQEKYTAAEREARIRLEVLTKPLWDMMPTVHDNISSQVHDGELILKDELEKAIEVHEESYRNIIGILLSDYRKIEKQAKCEKDAAIRLAHEQFENAIKELQKVDDWFEFRRTYQKSSRPMKKDTVPLEDLIMRLSETIDKIRKLKAEFHRTPWWNLVKQYKIIKEWSALDKYATELNNEIALKRMHDVPELQ